MKFMYLGEGSTTVFGLTFKAGEAVEVTDAHAIKKLTANNLFAHNDEPEASAPKVEDQPKRMGRPPKAKTDGQN
jgi:hypothetical protein